MVEITELEEIYKKIYKIRKFENILNDFIGKGLVHGTAHLSIGQEFIPVIISRHINKEDTFTSTHRGHSHALAKGLNLRKFVAELMGKEQGYNFGRGGTQHVMSKEFNYYANGITGGMVPVANGIAFANKYRGDRKVVISFFGDGAINEGYVMEALNLAAVFSLPIVFICENNLYAMSTPSKSTNKVEIYKKAEAFGINSILIENNDYNALDDAVKISLKNAREKSIPSFIEVRTYRHLGHSKNDKNLYRNKDEENFWFSLDVMEKIKQKILTDNPDKEKELKEFRDKTDSEVTNTFEELAKINEECSLRIGEVYSK